MEEGGTKLADCMQLIRENYAQFMHEKIKEYVGKQTERSVSEALTSAQVRHQSELKFHEREGLLTDNPQARGIHRTRARETVKAPEVGLPGMPKARSPLKFEGSTNVAPRPNDQRHRYAREIRGCPACGSPSPVEEVTESFRKFGADVVGGARKPVSLSSVNGFRVLETGTKTENGDDLSAKDEGEESLALNRDPNAILTPKTQSRIRSHMRKDPAGDVKDYDLLDTSLPQKMQQLEELRRKREEEIRQEEHARREEATRQSYLTEVTDAPNLNLNTP